MAFIQKIYEDDKIKKIYVNDNVPHGSSKNSQILKQYQDGTWKLKISSEFTQFFIPLTTEQAEHLINGDKFYTYDCEIVNTQFYI